MSKGWVSAGDIADGGKVRDGVFVLDVRTTAEFREAHIPGSTNIPLGEPELEGNVRSLVSALVKAKPAAAKGTYLRSVTLSSTMGPGVSVDVETATASE